MDFDNTEDTSEDIAPQSRRQSRPLVCQIIDKTYSQDSEDSESSINPSLDMTLRGLRAVRRSINYNTCVVLGVLTILPRTSRVSTAIQIQINTRGDRYGSHLSPPSWQSLCQWPLPTLSILPDNQQIIYLCSSTPLHAATQSFRMVLAATTAGDLITTFSTSYITAHPGYPPS